MPRLSSHRCDYVYVVLEMKVILSLLLLGSQQQERL